MTRHHAGWAWALVCLLLAACGYRAAPVERRGSAPRYEPPAPSSTRIQRPSHYTVRQGDTLYAIAWRYGLDYRDLARWNNITGNYTIYPGQAVRLYPARQAPPAPVASADPKAPDTASPPAQPASDSAPPQTPGREQTVRLPVTPSPSPQVQNPPPAANPEPVAAVAAAGPLQWQWPVSGQVVGEFSASVTQRQGLDIRAAVGTAVKAAAAGQVVYSGSGLAGYGELIIVKHSDRFLSAYAHNRRRLVREGETVKSGQKIAEIGQTGAEKPKLHFQIRDNGKPVDPRKHLPRHRN